MPAKKGGARAKRKPTKKPLTEKLSAEAPEKQDEPGQIIDQHELVQHYTTPNQNAARRLLYVAVGCTAAVIIALWGWSLRLQMENVNWRASQESSLFAEAKQNLDNAFQADKNAAAVPVVSVREGLERVVANYLAPGQVTASSSIGAASSTTENTNSTNASTTTE